MKRYTCIIYAVAMLLLVACNNRKSSGDVFQGDMENVVDTLLVFGILYKMGYQVAAEHDLTV